MLSEHDIFTYTHSGGIPAIYSYHIHTNTSVYKTASWRQILEGRITRKTTREAKFTEKQRFNNLCIAHPVEVYIFLSF